MTPTRPVLRYHGGKWRISEWVISHLPPHHTYVEPFGGAGSVLLRKPRSAIEVYNDLDADVVGLFRVLRDPAQAELLRRACTFTPYSRAEFLAAWERTGDPVEDARRLVVRTAMCIGIKSRASRNGWRAGASHHTPSTMWAGWPRHIPSYVDRLREVLIEDRPALDVIEQYDRPATLFYVDPPYLLSTRGWDQRRVYDHEMSEADHIALLDRLQVVDGMVVLSGYASPLYRETLRGWRMVETRARAQGNAPRVEAMWLNPAAAAAVRQPGLV